MVIHKHPVHKKNTIYKCKCTCVINETIKKSMFKNSEQIVCYPIQTLTFLISSTHLMT